MKKPVGNIFRLPPRENKPERPGESGTGNSTVGEKEDDHTGENFTAVISSLYLFTKACKPGARCRFGLYVTAGYSSLRECVFLPAPSTLSPGATLILYQ